MTTTDFTRTHLTPVANKFLSSEALNANVTASQWPTFRRIGKKTGPSRRFTQPPDPHVRGLLPAEDWRRTRRQHAHSSANKDELIKAWSSSPLPFPNAGIVIMMFDNRNNNKEKHEIC